MDTRMSSASPIASRAKVPALVAVAGPAAETRFLEFFASNINNAHTSRVYPRATREFLAWCERAGVTECVDAATRPRQRLNTAVFTAAIVFDTISSTPNDPNLAVDLD